MRLFGVFLLNLMIAVLWSQSGTAAPQLLMVAATDDRVSLHCEGGTCTAEIGTICLQPDRPTPAKGTRYKVVEDDQAGDRIRLVGIAADGRQVRLPLDHLASISAERHHAAVSVRVDQALLRQHGVVATYLKITRPVTLAPMPVDGDALPQTEADLALARDVLRPLGELMLERHAPRVAAAKLTRVLINALPTGRKSGAEARERALQRALQGPHADQTKRSVRAAYRACESLTSSPHWRNNSFRSCLGDSHDRLLSWVGRSYRKELSAGY